MRLRRLAASLLTGLALLGATLAWSAFATGYTVFDGGGSERVADVLVQQRAVREALAQALAKALRSGPAAEAQIPGAEVDSAARRVVDDSRTVALLHRAIAGAHQRLVGQADGPVRLDADALAQAARDALIEVQPRLAATLPVAPLTVQLPTDKLPDLFRVRPNLGRAGRVGGLAAVCLLAAAFLLAPDRPGVLRRAGRWAVRVGLASTVTGWLLPSLLSRADNPHLALIGGLAVAVGGRIVGPAMVLAATGLGATVAARVWRAAQPVTPPAPGAAAPATAPGPGETALPPVAA